MSGNRCKSINALSAGSQPASGRLAKLLGNMLLFYLVLMLGFFAVTWILSDVSGEYTGNHPALGTLQMSVVRRPTNLSGYMSYGRLPLLEMTEGRTGKDGSLRLFFRMPSALIKTGRPDISVTFKGRFKDGTITGTLDRDGITYKVRLKRDPLSSIYRQIQSHLPWLG